MAGSTRERGDEVTDKVGDEVGDGMWLEIYQWKSLLHRAILNLLRARDRSRAGESSAIGVQVAVAFGEAVVPGEL
jgi:hypothetical protein